MIHSRTLWFIFTGAPRRPASTLQHVIPTIHTAVQPKTFSPTHLRCMLPLLPFHTAWLRWPRSTQNACTHRVSHEPVRTETIMEHKSLQNCPAAVNVPICWHICGLKIHKFSPHKPVHAVQWSPARLYPPLLESGFQASPSIVFAEQWVCAQPVNKQRADTHNLASEHQLQKHTA